MRTALTRRGWMLAAGTAVLGALGRVLAMTELFVLAAGAAALVVASQVAARIPRPRLDASRRLSPPKVHAGDDSRVELTLRNVGRRRTPVVLIRDPFDDGRRQARFLLAPLREGERASASYRLPTEQRGVFTIGPLNLEVSDSFGLASRVKPVAGSTQLTVYPRIDPIVPLPQTHGHDPHGGADHPTALGASGDDFYALRPYQMGDDLRRVHWPSTARVDDLMIRQLEMPWQGRATVLLDVRAGAHEGESLELAVSAAASIASACWRRGSLVRLVTTGGLDSGFAAGPRHVESIMEKLATVGPAPDQSIETVLAGLRGPGNSGALVLVLTAQAPAADVERAARLRRRFGLVTVVLFEPSSYRDGPARPPPGGAPSGRTAGTLVVRATGDEPFAAAWNRALGSGSAGGARPRAAVSTDDERR